MLRELLVELFKDELSQPRPGYSVFQVRRVLREQGHLVPVTKLKKELSDMVTCGQLVVLSGSYPSIRSLFDTRYDSAYYMFPEKAARYKQRAEEMRKEPFWKQAKETVLDRYQEEVVAEFERLWSTETQ